jgi:hypothetical protein
MPIPFLKDWCVVLLRTGSIKRSSPVDLSGAFVNGILAIIGYVVIFVGVYKVHQIATDIREIKDLVASARRSSAAITPLPRGLAPEIAKDLVADDSATAYAQSLLRTVNAESHPGASEPREVR